MKKSPIRFYEILLFFILNVICCTSLFAQDNAKKITVTGKVTNDMGQPMVNATVKVADETTTALTNENGFYTIVVNKNGTLLFSYVGYEEQDIKVNGSNQRNVQFTLSSKDLNTVTVIGYGSQKKKNITGAMGGIGSKEIKQVAVVSLDQALQGRVSGVQIAENSAEPGASVSIRIRGIASITSGSEPLVVVDGVPMSVNLSAINPSDIETIDVLKDAASAAIYGSRGSAGVILVTTKRGKSGKLKVNLDAYTGQQFITKRIDMLTGPQFAKLANENLVNGGQDANPAWQSPENLISTNWQDEVFRTAPMNNYNISLSGGNEKSKNFLSFGYIKQDGVLSTEAQYERFTARFNGDYAVSDRFKIGVNVNYNTERKNGIRTQDDNTGTIISILQQQPTDPVRTDIVGDFGDHLSGYQGFSLARLRNLYYTGSNPVYVVNNHYYNRGKGSQLLANVFGEVEIINGLKFRTMIGYTTNNGFGLNGNGAVPTSLSFGGLNSKAEVNSSFNQSNQWNWVNTLSYTKDIDKHNFSILAGTDALRNTGSFLVANGRDAPLNQPSVSASDPNTRDRVFGNKYVPSSLFSYLSRASYSYDSRYLLSATFRRDGSSKFGPLNVYGNFPSVSVGWRIGQEKFMDNVDFVDELKIRASYGAVGNQGIPDLQYFSSYGNARGQYAYTLNGVLVPGLRPTVLGNDAIRWEKNVERNIGVDGSLLKGKITFSVDVYNKQLKDLLGEVPIPFYAAPFGGKIIQNAFTMENRGFELNLGLNQRVGDFNLSFNANFSKLNNKVTGLTPGEDKSFISQQLGGLSEMNATTRTLIGQPVGNFWGYVEDGIFQNAAEVAAGGMENVKPGDRRYKDLNGDKKITPDDRQIIGNGLPGYYYGFNVRAEYKGFDVNVFCNGQGDAQIANMLHYYTSSLNFRTGGFVNGSTDLLNSWKGEGTSNTLPRNAFGAPNSNNWFSTAYIEDASFLRIRNIQIGYTFPAKLLEQVGMSGARLYMSGQNLLTFTNYSGFDPEVGSNSGTGGARTATAGVDYGRYPMAKIITVGFTTQF